MPDALFARSWRPVRKTQQNPVRAGRGWCRSLGFKDRTRRGRTQRAGGPYALAILPFLMQPVQTRMRLAWPLIRALTACRFTLQRRRVMLWA